MLNGITLLSEEEKDEFALLQSLQCNPNPAFYDGYVMWHLGELHMKMKLPIAAHTYFMSAVKYHIELLQQQPHTLDSWVFLQQRYQDGIGIAPNPQMAAICANNIALLRQQPSLDQRPLTLPVFKPLSAEEGKNFLTYFELQRKQMNTQTQIPKSTEATPEASRSLSLS